MTRDGEEEIKTRPGEEHRERKALTGETIEYVPYRSHCPIRLHDHTMNSHGRENLKCHEAKL